MWVRHLTIRQLVWSTSLVVSVAAVGWRDRSKSLMEWLSLLYSHAPCLIDYRRYFTPFRNVQVTVPSSISGLVLFRLIGSFGLLCLRFNPGHLSIPPLKSPPTVVCSWTVLSQLPALFYCYQMDSLILYNWKIVGFVLLYRPIFWVHSNRFIKRWNPHQPSCRLFLNFETIR